MYIFLYCCICFLKCLGELIILVASKTVSPRLFKNIFIIFKNECLIFILCQNHLQSLNNRPRILYPILSLLYLKSILFILTTRADYFSRALVKRGSLQDSLRTMILRQNIPRTHARRAPLAAGGGGGRCIIYYFSKNECLICQLFHFVVQWYQQNRRPTTIASLLWSLLPFCFLATHPPPPSSICY